MAASSLEAASIDQETTDTSPEYPDVGADAGSEINFQAEEAAERLANFPEIQPGNWEQLDENQRIEALQNVENQIAEIQGRPGLSVQPVEMPANTYGQYDGNEIQINSASIMDGGIPVNEFVDTIVHEGQHAYQDYAIQNPGFEADSVKSEQWADNFLPGNYLSAEDFGQEIYMNQPVEADAWSYASAITSAIYPGQSKIGG